MVTLNATHDPSRKSWVESANEDGTDFPIQNLPFGVFTRPGEQARGGVAIGRFILDLRQCLQAGLISGRGRRGGSGDTLNPLLELGNGAASTLRAALSDLLRHDGAGSTTRAGSSCRWKRQRCCCQPMFASSATCASRPSISAASAIPVSVTNRRCRRSSNGCRSAITAERARS